VTSAVVLGGGFAGVLAARVLADSLGETLLIEASTYPAAIEPRRGLPQAHHNHMLVTGGALALDTLLPGAVASLAGAGALRRDLTDGALVLSADGWFRRHRTGADVLTCSRWLTDHAVRHRALAGSQISVLESTRALRLLGSPDRVTGVEVSTGAGAPRVLRADVVVDATGRRSRTAAWLADLGGPAVPEETLDEGLAYATRLYRAPDDIATVIPAVMIHPKGLAGPHARGATVVPVEGGRWIVTLTGARNNEPPVATSAFEACARTLRSSVVSDLMAVAEPLGRPRPYRDTANRRRFYERVRMPDGLLVLGDALSAVNPVHSHGMSVAALQVLALRDFLREHGPDLAAFSRLQTEFAARADGPWRFATGHGGRLQAAPPEATRERWRKLTSPAAAADFFQRQVLLRPDSECIRALLRELAKPAEDPPDECEAVSQYPALAGLRARRCWYSARPARIRIGR
jgi:2-polyprenyl-6-methoxyphenol hydroxylase-like FAD-dependent oxidoreductase